MYFLYYGFKAFRTSTIGLLRFMTHGKMGKVLLILQAFSTIANIVWGWELTFGFFDFVAKNIPGILSTVVESCPCPCPIQGGSKKRKSKRKSRRSNKKSNRKSKSKKSKSRRRKKNRK